MTDQTENSESLISTQRNIPLVVKFVAIIVLVSSILGTAYYSYIVFYEVYNPHFLDNIIVDSNQVNHVFLYVLLNSILNCTILISTILILRRKKLAIYILNITPILLIANEVLIGNLYGISFSLVYLACALILFLYRNRIAS